MLTHKHRFHGHGSLRYVFSKGKINRTKHFMLRYTPNSQRVHSRFAVIVSKKVSKRAVQRNRIRRRVFETIRTRYEQDIPYDVSIAVFSLEVLTMSTDELTAELAVLTAPLHSNI